MPEENSKAKAPQIVAAGVVFLVLGAAVFVVGGAMSNNDDLGATLISLGLAIGLGAIGIALIIVGAAANLGEK